MNPTIINERQHHILFDSDVISQIVPQWFTVEYWQGRANVRSAARGRGKAWFIDDTQRAMVLRHYQRGGAMAGLFNDKYIWTGLENTRAWREWHLLALLYEQGLPVPQPCAALVQRSGLLYRADIMTLTIPDSQSLSDLLIADQPDDAVWRLIGQTIRRFHLAGVYHADLNAHNILLDKNGKVYLIDFDKGGIRKAKNLKWQTANLQRLQRSLNKLQIIHANFHYQASDWRMIMDGYASL